ncbi:capsule assembly Wzi family protein [Roseivirga misakiensis]|uniref:Capsule assembly Wzi family protein n=1 Tax=Roseivirga misakiensis TaxID=1563681 RepID=A0A1E5T5V1_9BACT|nr:capsule assembly Wzi family protein [Roseivirga misakiensis]OEK06749.1 hypothetical protein BFP71_03555 [Roseivirga misakiensis]
MFSIDQWKSTVLRALLLTCLALKLSTSQALSQVSSDSLSLSVGTGFYFSGDNAFLPHYIQFGSYGEVDATDVLFVKGDAFYQNKLSKSFDISLGVSFRNDVLSSAYFRAKYRNWRLEIGRVQREVGGTSSGLGTGSLAISNNATPVPMLILGNDDYFSVPFTHDYFKLKGNLAHGWLESARYISKAQLHYKSFHAQVDLSRELGLKVSSGIIHFAQFGGYDPNGVKQPSSFDDYLKVFLGEGIPNPDGTMAGESNAVGNHLGITEITLEKEFGSHNLTLNYQKPFEDEGGIQYISLTDYMISLNWELPAKDIGIRRVQLEMVQSKWQGGPGIPDPTRNIQTIEDNQGYDFGQRDDYYNNYLYRSGWTYNGMVIGNPLFLTYARTLNFFEVYSNHGVAIANNRLWALNLGVSGALTKSIDLKWLFTYSRNFGSYAGLYDGRFSWNGILSDPDFDYPFRPEQTQFYSVIELGIKNIGPTQRGILNIKIAQDFGDMYDLFGLELSYNHRIY